MVGNNSIVTENFLRLNFLVLPGKVGGTDNLLAMNCDQISSRYKVAVVGATTSGNRLPSQNQVMALPNCGITVNGTITRVSFVGAVGSTVSQGESAITERGFCYKVTGGAYPLITDSKLIGGSGLGSFTGTLSPLLPNTGYIVRTYGINSYGVGYSDTVLSFTTLP